MKHHPELRAPYNSKGSKPAVAQTSHGLQILLGLPLVLALFALVLQVGLITTHATHPHQRPHSLRAVHHIPSPRTYICDPAGGAYPGFLHKSIPRPLVVAGTRNSSPTSSPATLAPNPAPNAAQSTHWLRLLLQTCTGTSMASTQLAPRYYQYIMCVPTHLVHTVSSNRLPFVSQRPSPLAKSAIGLPTIASLALAHFTCLSTAPPTLPP